MKRKIIIHSFLDDDIEAINYCKIAETGAKPDSIYMELADGTIMERRTRESGITYAVWKNYKQKEDLL